MPPVVRASCTKRWMALRMSARGPYRSRSAGWCTAGRTWPGSSRCDLAGLLAAPVEAAGLAVDVERAGKDIASGAGPAAGLQDHDVAHHVEAGRIHGALVGFADVGDARIIEDRVGPPPPHPARRPRPGCCPPPSSGRRAARGEGRTSTMVTSWPAAESLSQMCDPKKPEPPKTVTFTVFLPPVPRPTRRRAVPPPARGKTESMP